MTSSEVSSAILKPVYFSLRGNVAQQAQGCL